MSFLNKSKNQKYKPKVWIYADMEGVNNVTKWEEVNPASSDYKKGSRLMTREVNSAIKGFCKTGANEVFINDLHWFYDNLIMEKLDKRANVCYGVNLNIDGFLSKPFDAVAIVGMHAKAHSKDAILAHSWYLPTYIHSLKFNGRFIGEVDMIKFLADEKGIPLIFISGDNAGCSEAKELEEEVFTAITKSKIAEKITLIPRGKANRLVRKKAGESVKHLIENGGSKRRKAKKSGKLEATFGSKELSDTIQYRCKLKKVYCKRKGDATLEFKGKLFSEVLQDFLGVLD